ncbi:hypothetical protein Rumeso_00964 [Rubellimicrobium mesophilum DSM 19309]|uniref:DnaJ homologue subfamily C member 28 conserved domain-containing protein n=1 Tax=Rubellimicrobium mesophilum DSM 19309 TaxID=442562 RepID=A0A017HSV3_9RHOB|nr:DnaJ family domain-containing protein [Rubellimicrobium mesophilum]EYD77415.1 hypothetical protein Rumeso_00964 [Rubellimicrobium mesophilum DSM 19309]
MSSFLDILVERALAEARAKGSVDDLPGTGKPIDPATLARSAYDDLYARALSESGAVHPVAEMQQRINEAQARLTQVTDPEVQRAVRKEIAGLQTRQAVEMEQLRRYT